MAHNQDGYVQKHSWSGLVCLHWRSLRSNKDEYKLTNKRFPLALI